MPWIMGRRLGNRGASNVIAALLLIAIAVAAAVLLYVFSIGLVGFLQTGGGQQTKQQLIMSTYNWVDPTSLSLTLKNVGTMPIDVGGADVFIEGVQVSNPGNCGVVNPGNSCILNITLTGMYTSGKAYAVKIVTPDGAVFSYTAIAGQAS